MCNLFLIFQIIIFLVLYSCNSSNIIIDSKKNKPEEEIKLWESITVGMDSLKVNEILGKPDHRSFNENSNTIAFGYGKTYFNDYISDGAYILLDSLGKVVSIYYPSPHP